MKKLLAAFVGVCVLTFLYLFFWPVKEERSFDQQHTRVSPQDLHWTIEIDEEKRAELLQLLRQPFFFLDQGKQMEAYESRDGKVVFKLLRKKPLDLKPPVRHLPDVFPFVFLKERQEMERRMRKEALFSSLLLSYQVIPEETGTLFVHITHTVPLHTQVFLMDSAQNPHVVDLDEVHWVLQRRASLVRPELASLMWEKKEDAAKRRIDQIFDLLVLCAKKGIIDVDPNLVRNDNIGFLEDRAIYIDTGKLRLSSEILTKQAFEYDLRRLSSLHKWLRFYYPELAIYFEKKRKEVIAEW